VGHAGYVQEKETVRREAEAGGSLVPLPAEFYEPSASTVAPLLLGHWLVRNTPTGPSGGIIVETEAYLANDPACHGYKRETPRNRAMYGPPGRAYVYFIYGNHWCFNAVCCPAGTAEAVLVRAIEPSFGLAWMQSNRRSDQRHELTNGPAKFCAALRIDRTLDAANLCDREAPIFIAENPQRAGVLATSGPLVTTTRVGITQAADWPLRFYLEGSPFVSRRARLPRRRPDAGAIKRAVDTLRRDP
jgi:DNA-3-methyladenine glycosylase